LSKGRDILQLSGKITSPGLDVNERVGERIPGVAVKLRHWYAVHGRIGVTPLPAAILDSIRPRATGVTHDCHIENGGWRNGGFHLLDASGPLIFVRRLVSGDESYLWDRPDWETELRSWDGPNCETVIQHIHQTRQTISITPIAFTLGSTKLARICEQVSGCVARATDGLIHVYQEGFFNAEGESLLPYCPQHRLKTR